LLGVADDSRFRLLNATRYLHDAQQDLPRERSNIRRHFWRDLGRGHGFLARSGQNGAIGVDYDHPEDDFLRVGDIAEHET